MRTEPDPGTYVRALEDVDRTMVEAVGAKAANLGELMRIADIHVPGGFCVTTAAFRRTMAAAPAIDELLARLARVDADDPDSISTISGEIRGVVDAVAIPDDVVAAITAAAGRLGDQAAWAVRSSATTEDRPGASFAGQHDSYLNVVGPAAVVHHVRRCWASLFTTRAVTYRRHDPVDDRRAEMGVVVQQMVPADAAGVMFTADPVTSNRRVVTIEASIGLGEAVVAGIVNPDAYSVRDGAIVTRSIGTKRSAIDAAPGGGTHERTVAPADRERPVLTDAQVVRLAAIGRRIEAHIGRPQDIEWCVVDDEPAIVQSRPITTLFPIPRPADGDRHVYLSVGHQQMMTDPMRPLGLSLFRLTARPPMHEAGGRLFVDVTQTLASPAARAGLLELMGRSDPLMQDALRTLLDRDEIAPTRPDDGPVGSPPGAAPVPLTPDPAVVTELIARAQASIGALRDEIRGTTGEALLDVIVADIPELKRILFDPASHAVFMAAMEATWWLNEHLHSWLGVTNAADTLSLSVPHNVTSEMGLALLDVADVVRPHPAVVAFLRDVDDDDELLDHLAELDGGPEARVAIEAYLAAYGMRGVGEIDITRPRWSERPTSLVPMILGNVRNFEHGERERRFADGRRRAQQARDDLLAQVRSLPDGAAKADETARMIDLVRTFIGYREYPKYAMISRYAIYKDALMDEAARLVRSGAIRERDDIFFLSLPELHDVTRGHPVDEELVRQRKDVFRSYEPLVPPRVLTSDGEALAGTFRRDDLPPGALVGLAVSAGTVEGRARVVADVADADLEAGDILVTAFTDPSWSPLFVAIAGLVTEVGGLMTHGSVIAREYGVPAVVGVDHATRLIRDGQRIRVDGTHGSIELLDPT